MLSSILLVLFVWGFLAGVPIVAAWAVFFTLPGLGFKLKGSGWGGQHIRPAERRLGWALLASALWLVVEAFTLDRVWNVIVALDESTHDPFILPLDILRLNAEIAGVGILGLASIAATGLLLYLLLVRDIRPSPVWRTVARLLTLLDAMCQASFTILFLGGALLVGGAVVLGFTVALQNLACHLLGCHPWIMPWWSK